MSSTVKNFLEVLRTSNVISDKNQELTFQANIIKALDNHQKNSSLILLKKFFTNAQFQLIDGEISVNHVPIKKIEPLLRAGQLKGLFELLYLPQHVTSTHEYNFQLLLSPEIPEINIFKLNEKYKQAQRLHPDLDVLVETSKDIERKLTKLARKKLNIFQERIKSMAKNGIVRGIFAEVKVDDKLLDNIANATNSRQGCYLIKTDKNLTKSFKLVNRSCYSSNNPTNTSDELNSIANSLPYNLQIYLRVVIANNTEKIKLINAFGLNDTEVIERNISYLILKHESGLWNYFTKNNYGNKLFDELSDEKKKSLIEGLCKKNDGKSCISSFPYAPRDSIDFVDVSKLPVNTSMMCVKKTTLLELLVDIGVDLSIQSRSCSVI